MAAAMAGQAVGFEDRFNVLHEVPMTRHSFKRMLRTRLVSASNEAYQPQAKTESNNSAFHRAMLAFHRASVTPNVPQQG
jgi:hypothetical protein